jgi:predicted PurR-regulated permease PerM
MKIQPQHYGRERDAQFDAEAVRARLHALAGIPLSPQLATASSPESNGLRAVTRPLWILAAIALLVVLRVGREVLVPLLLAVLLALVLSGIVEALRRYRVPRGVSAMVLLAAGVLAIGCGVNALCAPAQSWVQSAPKVLRTIEHRVRPARAVVVRVNDIAARAAALAGGPRAGAPAAQEPVAAVTTVGVLEQTGSALGALVTVCVLTLLLLAGGPPMLAHLSSSLGGNLHAAHTLRLIDAIRVEVGRYYGTLALINLGLGAATGVAMWLLGMPNPMLWGAVAAGLNFVPYLGAAATLTILTVVAFVSFESIAHVALVAASFLSLATIEGQLVEPVFLGRRLHLNPIVVFVAMWVGGWLWGIPGIIFALPVLVAVKVAATHSENGMLLARFLGPARQDCDDKLSSSIVELPVVLQGRPVEREPAAL